MNFCSDNVTGASPEILAALTRANTGTVPSYGEDPFTAASKASSARSSRPIHGVPGGDRHRRQCAVAGRDDAALWRRLLPEDAHISVDECGAPEFFTGGAKLMNLVGGGKVSAGRDRGGAAAAA